MCVQYVLCDVYVEKHTNWVDGDLQNDFLDSVAVVIAGSREPVP